MRYAIRAISLVLLPFVLLSSALVRTREEIWSLCFFIWSDWKGDVGEFLAIWRDPVGHMRAYRQRRDDR